MVDICTAEKKSRLSAICKKARIPQEDFVNFIVASEAGLLPWRHKISSRDFVPEHLQLTQKDIDASRDHSEVGKPASPAMNKSLNKSWEAGRQRRLLVGHLFYTPSLDNWHLFYFDQRDREGRTNHWAGGAHIHLVNWLWPGLNCQSTWEYFNSGNVQMKGALHIRFLRSAGG